MMPALFLIEEKIPAMPPKQPTTNERLAAIEALLSNHVLHALRALDQRLWAVVILLVGTLLAVLLR